ncbi:probable DNA mismatch repair protein Msh6 [Anastrepha ludens]|uniref:probable DNA mismatch repair protein Msh6 n=1 Tax=Anastrepha ludens TaxID=28586 RepID=UPI0023AF9471|nr:probable DNA mismatch repair protein Msh6 [Anastrepha ludens]
MSKKLNKSGSAGGSGTPSNTLFKYFSRSPATAEKKKIPRIPSEEDSKNLSKDMGKENLENGRSFDEEPSAKRKLEIDLNHSRSIKMDLDDDEDEDITIKRSKNKRQRIFDSEDEEDIKSTVKAKKEDDKADYKPSDEDDEDSSDDQDVSVTKETFSKKSDEPKQKKPKLEKGSFMEKLASLQASATITDAKTAAKNDAKYEKIVCTTSTLDEPVVWPHQKLDFLQPNNIKDKQGRRPDHPDYDPTTLYVPDKYLNSLSPGVRQWWILKSDNYDCVLFFKVGKFYELYHMDAEIGVQELGFVYMRGEFAHSGSPEVSFDKMSSILVDRGYKVARVEQTETTDMMSERCKKIKATKFDKVVRREICQISNRGTQVFGTQCQITPHHQPNYMLAVVEKNESSCSKYGVCYVDTSIGDFYIGEFEDDKNGSRLLTLLSHHMPVLLIYERGSLSERTQEIFRTMLSAILKDPLPANGSKVCSAEKTLKQFAENYYAKMSDGKNSADNWPLALRTMQSESDHLGLTPRDDCKLALKALGQCVMYLKRCQLEEKVLPMARYHLYTPPDMLNESTKAEKPQLAQQQTARRRHMVIDATTLANLRITGEEYSLQATLDNCCTKFGKRLLHHWICSPSCELDVIVERQQAITELVKHAMVLQDLRALLAPMPDFERHLAQIHLFGNKRISEGHPDGRAILFEEKLYNKKKIQNFIGILKGFTALMEIPTLLEGFESPLIKRLTQLQPTGVFPDMAEQLEFFKNAFDHETGAKTGVIAPEQGVDADYDEVLEKINSINATFKDYLTEQEKFFGCRLTPGGEKNRFQLEVPENAARKAGKAYQLEGQRKGNKPVRRFSTNETRSLVKQLQNAELERDAILKDLARRIFEKFSNHYELWKQCVDCVANLDVLASLTEYARGQQVICVPELQEQNADQQPFVDIAEGYHPCAPVDTFIPNGITLGTGETPAPLSILTGPNMGGKSTLMRQVGLLVVMAQIGAHVPAAHCRMSLVDRIFTRLGAQDDIMAGQSTFLVELNETSLILKHATVNSLVLLDELGRGTATYDGTAIAASVVNYLADLKSRTLFSTHYHNLIEYFHKDTRITLGHMACMVENEDTEDPTQETVTFLYKYTAGACPKSYGFNAAKLAGMPQPIIKRAYELSKRVEAIALRRKILSKVVAGAGNKCSDLKEMKNLLLQLKSCRV